MNDIEPSGSFTDIFHSALDMNLKAQIHKIFSNLHPADQADLIVNLNVDDRKKLIRMLGEKLDPELLVSLDDNLRAEIIRYIDKDILSKLLTEMDSDDAVDILENFEDDLTKEAINSIQSKEQKEDIEEQLSYPRNSVGRIMDQNHYIAVSKNWDVEEFYKYIKKNKNIPEGFIDIIVVDEYFRPISTLSITEILKADLKTKISKIMRGSEDLRIINANMDQKKATKLFIKYDLDYMPVINDNGVLIGIINSNDIMNVMSEENSKYMMLISKNTKENHLTMSPFKLSKMRVPWLLLSFFSGMVNAIIIDMFHKTTENLIVLAALVSLISNLSGVSGTQTISILIKNMANGNTDKMSGIKIILKQVLVGILNGAILSFVIFLFTFIWKKNLYLALVYAVSIFLMQIFATFFGSFTPLMFDKLKLDPAITSTAFITGLLDSLSSIVLLGLATLFLM